MEYYNLENCCQLHERIEIVYVVDGYIAKLVREDETVVAEAEAETIDNALFELDLMLTGWDRDMVRTSIVESITAIHAQPAKWQAYAEEQAKSIVALPRYTRLLFVHYQHPKMLQVSGTESEKDLRALWLKTVDAEIKKLKKGI